MHLLLKKFWVFALMALPLTGIPQQPVRVRLIDASELRFDNRMGSSIKRLIGNVALEHDGAMMYCDSAWLNEASNSFEAFSRVRIRSGDTLNLYGERLTYDGNARLANIEGNVKMIDKKTTLQTSTLVYNRNTDIAYYENNAEILDAQNRLTSNTGYYVTREKRIYFRRDVQLYNPEYVMYSDTLVYATDSRIAYFHGPTFIQAKNASIRCENGWYNTVNDKAQFNKRATIISGEHTIRGDSLFFDRKNESGRALNNVMISDTVQNILLMGNYGEYFKNLGYTYISQKPVAVMVQDSDSLFMHADTIRAYFDSTQAVRMVKAYFKVRYYRSNLQGKCDSMAYNVTDSLIQMYRSPVIWTGENQLSADTIVVKTKGEQVEWLTLTSAAFIINRDDTLSFNQVKGRRMTGYFTENELKTIHVTGNAETLYYVREDDRSLLGLNKMIASSMRIELLENKISRIYYFERPIGSVIPEQDITSAQRELGNFNWQEGIRPKSREDIFNRN